MEKNRLKLKQEFLFRFKLFPGVLRNENDRLRIYKKHGFDFEEYKLPPKKQQNH